MKKVISINFQGRVVPIEESAYEIMKQYIESLRHYFSGEQGRDEIINDIEGRIAEIFAERLKKGVTCITDADVNEVIAGMGRPADFEAAEGDTASGNYRPGTTAPHPGSSSGPRRFYRNTDNKIIGGVASGLANYLDLDPVIMRVIFVLLSGALFWVYLLLWIIVPSRSLQRKITKRLYRSSEEKVIGGVCGGLAAYFNTDVWIPRLIFALPVVFGFVSGSMHFWESWDLWIGPRIITNSLSSTLFITYIILWIAVPVATTSAQKLEMKGERIDLNTIRDTVKEDLMSFKGRAEKWGKEVQQSARQMGSQAAELGESAQVQAGHFAREAESVARKTSSGIGRILIILAKAFLFFIGGIIALTLFVVLIALLVGIIFLIPYNDFILEGYGQHTLVWGLLLVLSIPLIALITWLVRRLMGVRSRRHYLAYVFGGLFLLGFIMVPLFISSVGRNFKARSGVEETLPLVQPPSGKLFVEVESLYPGRFGEKWYRWEETKDWPFYGSEQDSFLLKNVRIHVAKSPDDNYHLTRVRMSRGHKAEQARTLAEKIQFTPVSSDSVLLLPRGFGITRSEKFRNQQVMLVIEIPAGKRLQMGSGVDDFQFYNINFNRGINVQWDEDRDDAFDWEIDTEYIMTSNEGLVRTQQLDPEALQRGEYRIIDPDFREGRFEKKMRKLQKKIDSLESGVIGAVDEPLNKSLPAETLVPAEADVSGYRANMLQRSMYVFGRIFQQ